MAILLAILSLWGTPVPHRFHCATKGRAVTCWTHLNRQTTFQCHKRNGWLICLQERDER